MSNSQKQEIKTTTSVMVGEGTSDIAFLEITPALVNQITNQVYAMLLQDLRLERERKRKGQTVKWLTRI
jgi:hypothetical protein